MPPRRSRRNSTAADLSSTHSQNSKVPQRSPEGTGSTDDVHTETTVMADTLQQQDMDSDDANHVKILVATDNHVGYMEKDPVRGQDSIEAFREILQLAVSNNVDFILLGGDLFHDNRPSRTSLHQVMGALREYTLGDKPVSIELLSDPNDGKAEGYHFPAINYEDENLNVAIPVFSIHGNHDDPQGIGAEGALSAVDLLSVTGLINYFGKVELPSSDSTAQRQASQAPSRGGLSDVGIRIRPILLQKGSTKVALYGMGNIKDERMHFELRNNRVRMYRPKEDPNDWFNILTIHQNRAGHDPKAVVPETMFDDSIHLVVWGHEHEQRLSPEHIAGKRYHISQPGSSVATSLSTGEAVEKKVGILHVRDRDFFMEPLSLKRVRPFVEDTIDLEEEMARADIPAEDKQGVGKILKHKVEDLIDLATQQWEQRMSRYPEQERIERMLPLIRLRVQYTRMDGGTLTRFGQDFVNRVANPKDLLQFAKKKTTPMNKEEKGEFVEPTEDMVPSEKLEKIRMSSLTQQYLAAQTLQILDPGMLDRSVMSFIDKDDRDAITHFVKRGLASTKSSLVSKGQDEARMLKELDRIRESHNQVVRPEDAGHHGVASDSDDGLFHDAFDSSSVQSIAKKKDEKASAMSSKSYRETIFLGESDSDHSFEMSDREEGVSTSKSHSTARSKGSAAGKQPVARSKPSSRPAKDTLGTSQAGGKLRTTHAPRRAGARVAAQKVSSRLAEESDDDDFEVA